MEFRASNPGTCTVDMDMASHAFEINTCCFCCWVSVGYSHQPPQKLQRQSKENVAVYLKNWWYIHQCSVNPPPKMRQASPGFWWAMSDPRRWRMDGVSPFFFHCRSFAWQPKINNAVFSVMFLFAGYIWSVLFTNANSCCAYERPLRPNKHYCRINCQNKKDQWNCCVYSTLPGQKIHKHQ